MAIDPSIPLQVRPVQMPDPLANYGRMVQLKSLMQQGDLQSMQMDQMVRDRAAQEAENAAYRDALDPATGQIDYGRLTRSLADSNRGRLIPGVMQQKAETDKKIADAKLADRNLTKADFDILKQRLDLGAAMLAPLAVAPDLNHQMFSRTIENMVRANLATADEGAEWVRTAPNDPRALRDLIRQRMLVVMDAKDRLAAMTPNLVQVTDGQTTSFVDRNPMTNPGGPAPIQMKATPGEILTDDRVRSEGDKNRAVQLLGQQREEARALRQMGKPVYDAERGAWVMPPSAQNPTGALAPVVGSSPRLPTAALKLQQEEVDALQTARTIETDINGVISQLRSGQLQLGPVQNVASQARNFAGASNEVSQNFAAFQAFIEKLRNDSLRLNKGVQTEGDAVRALNELMTNKNDPRVVERQLRRIQEINQRAAALRRNNINQIRENYGAGPIDEAAVVGNIAPATGAAAPAPAPQRPASTPRPGTVEDGWIFNGGDPADRNNWKRAR